MTAAIFLITKTQYENIGDALINRELIRLLQANGQLTVDASSMPPWFVDMLALPPSVNNARGSIRLFMAVVRERLKGRPTYFFLVPGGLSGEFTLPQYLRRSVLLSFLWLWARIGVRFCHVGVSYENLGKRHAVHLRQKQKLLHALYVRDNRTRQLLSSLGIATTGLLPDLAFNLADGTAQQGAPINKLCFSFRTDQHPGQFERVRAAVTQVLGRLPQNVQLDLSVQVEMDRPGMDRLQERLAADARVEAHVFEETRNIEKLQAFYAGKQLIVSNRLHVLLLGASVGCHVIACIDDRNEKILGLLETMGRQDLLLDMTNLSDESIDRALAAPRLDGRMEREKLRAGIARIFAPESAGAGTAP